MTLTVQEMSDRFEIQDLLVGYCYAVDDLNFDVLDQFFTDDAIIDYSEMVGVKGTLSEIKQFLSASLSAVTRFQHAVSTTQYIIDGDKAETRTVCSNPMVVPADPAAGAGGEEQTLFFGLWYIHTFRRTAKGWRIASLYEKKCYAHNLPEYITAQTA